MSWKNVYIVYLKIEFFRFFRGRNNAFFVYCYPVLLIGLFGSIFPASPFSPELSYLEGQIGGYLCLGMLTSMFISVFAEMEHWKEQDVYTSFIATPLTPMRMWLLSGLNSLLHGVLSAGVALLVAVVVFQVSIPPLFPLLLALLLTGLVNYSVGAFFTNMSLARLRMLGYFLLMFLSGAALPRSLFPPVIDRIANVFPLTYAVDLLTALWVPEKARLPMEANLLILVGFIVGLWSLIWLSQLWQRRRSRQQFVTPSRCQSTSHRDSLPGRAPSGEHHHG